MSLRRFSAISATLAAVALATLATPAQAALRSFTVTWSGASFGNSASAIALIVIEDTLLPNPGNSTGPLASMGIQLWAFSPFRLP